MRRSGCRQLTRLLRLPPWPPPADQGALDAPGEGAAATPAAPKMSQYLRELLGFSMDPLPVPQPEPQPIPQPVATQPPDGVEMKAFGFVEKFRQTRGLGRLGAHRFAWRGAGTFGTLGSFQ